MNQKEKKINYLMISLVFQLAIYILASNLSSHMPEHLKYFFDIVLYTVTFVCPIVLYMILSRKRRVPFLSFPQNKIDNPVLVIISALGVISAAGLVTDFWFYILESCGLDLSGTQAVLPENMPDMILYFIYMAVLPAIFEEILFRGIGLEAFMNTNQDSESDNGRNAIIMSAVLFAAMHCDVRKFLYAFCAGIIIGYYVYKSGSVFIGIIIHAINNTVSFAFLLLAEYGSEGAVFITNLIYSLVVITVAVLMFGRIIYKEKTNRKKTEDLVHEFGITVVIYLVITIYLGLREFI